MERRESMAAAARTARDGHTYGARRRHEEREGSEEGREGDGEPKDKTRGTYVGWRALGTSICVMIANVGIAPVVIGCVGG